MEKCHGGALSVVLSHLSTITEWYQDPPFPSSPGEWANRIPALWDNVKTALRKAAEIHKAQADKKRVSHKPFQGGGQEVPLH